MSWCPACSKASTTSRASSSPGSIPVSPWRSARRAPFPPRSELRVAFVLKGYPRLSEAFIAQEIAALERRGLEILICSLRRPTEARVHPVHREIRARVSYLPEYLWREPLRVFRSWLRMRNSPRYGEAKRL